MAATVTEATGFTPRLRNAPPHMNLKQLAAPFPAKDIHWRVGQRSEDGKQGRALPYISGRAVQDRLDEVVGVENWRSSMQDIVTGNRHVAARCSIGIFTSNGWVDKEDGAQVDANLGNNAEIAVKGAYTDAFKRAAVQWGIGRYLYGYQAQWVDLDEDGRMAEVPSLPPEFLPEGDTTRSTVVASEPKVRAATPAPAPEAGPEADTSATDARAEPAADAPSVEPQSQGSAQDAAPAVQAKPQPQPEPALAPAPVPVAAAPAAAEGSPDEAQPYTEAELEALPERERQYVRSITSHLAKRTSLQNLRAYVNGPKMQQNLPEQTRTRLTSLIDAAIGKQEMAAQA